MITDKQRAEILRLHDVEKWTYCTIAKHFHVHHSVVRRVLAPDAKLVKPTREKLITPYLSFLTENIERYPNIAATRLFLMVRERGFAGKITQFRREIVQLRGKHRSREAFLRISTIKGEECQVDWAHFPSILIGKQRRPLYAFVAVLSYSRAIFFRFFHGQSTEHFMRGHQEAFAWFGGVPRRALYDNLKSVVIAREGDTVQFNSDFLKFAGSYRFEPRPVGIRKGNEKGKVERAIRFIRTNFFEGREAASLLELNKEALEWCNSHSLDRAWQDDPSITVRAAWHEEKKQLLPDLSDLPLITEKTMVRVGKTPYGRFDLNNYTVPRRFVGQTITAHGDDTTVTFTNGLTVIAQHRRTFDRGVYVENSEHLDEIRRMKKEGKIRSQQTSLTTLLPTGKEFYDHLLKQGSNLPQITRLLSEYVVDYSASEVEHAICAAIDAGTIQLSSVRQILERRRQNSLKPVRAALPTDTQQKIKTVTTQHSLDKYKFDS